MNRPHLLCSILQIFNSLPLILSSVTCSGPSLSSACLYKFFLEAGDSKLFHLEADILFFPRPITPLSICKGLCPGRLFPRILYQQCPKKQVHLLVNSVLQLSLFSSIGSCAYFAFEQRIYFIFVGQGGYTAFVQISLSAIGSSQNTIVWGLTGEPHYLSDCVEDQGKKII